MTKNVTLKTDSHAIAAGEGFITQSDTHSNTHPHTLSNTHTHRKTHTQTTLTQTTQKHTH